MFLGARARRDFSARRLLQEGQQIHICCLDRLQNAFRMIGYIVGTWATVFLVISLLISSVSYGCFNIRVAQRLQDGFISRHSKARVEDAIKHQFDGEENRNVQRFVALIRRHSGGNLLDREIFREIKPLYSYIKNNISVEIDGRQYAHSDICGSYCEVNPLLWAFEHCVEGVYLGKDVFVDHPQSRIENRSFLMAPHVFGIIRKDHDHHEKLHIPFNSLDTWPSNSNRTALLSVSLISLYFQAPIPDDKSTNIVTEWEEAVFRWSQEKNRPFRMFEIDVMGDKVLGKEMTRGGLSLLPHLISGIGIITLLVAAMVIYNALMVGRKDCGLIIVIIGIILSPLLAVSSTFGLMGLFGIEVYPMHVVIPFLILAIGVDDAFLMTHSWDRLRPKVAPYGDKNNADLLAQVLAEVGPSITITSLTNAMAFAIGTAVSAPAMQMFCITAAVAICMDFLFEIILFGSMLVLAARFQKSGDTYDPTKNFRAKLSSFYAKLLTMLPIRIFVILFTAAFVAVSIYGTMKMETQIDSQKIIPNNSTLRISDHLFKEFYWKEYEPIFIYVNNPPKQLTEEAYRELHQMIREFEDMPRAIGAASTVFWLNDYEKEMKPLYSFYSLLGGDFFLDYQELPSFLQLPLIGDFYNRTIKWHFDEDRVVVDQFYFLTGMHNATTWIQRAENMLRWREIADQWEKYNVTVYSENSGVFEGIFSLGGQTILAAVLTLASMIVVCLFFVPSLIGVICAALAIASISLGVLGFLSLSGLDLDPVTMSAIVMSIGFSVDYTAHVSFHFQHSFSILPRTATSADCVQYTVDAVGWPMAEAALSTLACFAPVAFHNDYTPTVFVRTIFCVVIFGVIHGLVILPTVLAMIPRKFFVFDSPESNPQTSPKHTLIFTPPNPMPPKATVVPSETDSSSSNDTMVSLLSNVSA